MEHFSLAENRTVKERRGNCNALLKYKMNLEMDTKTMQFVLNIC